MNDKGSNLSPEIRDIWTDAYKFHATFENMGNSDEEWTRCAFTMGQLAVKHGNHPLVHKILIAVYDYLSDERKTIALAEAKGRAGID